MANRKGRLFHGEIKKTLIVTSEGFLSLLRKRELET